MNSRVLPPVATSALIALALSFFYLPHLLGEAVFPWDFRGGYHAQAFAWYADGSFFAPPEWFPYGDFGFPAALALQSSGWVLPLSMLSTLDIPFTFTNLARLQIVLVWFAGLGISALARVERMSWTAAAVVGVGYVLSSAFYANQQHVDVIRGYVLLPWVLLALHRRTARHRFAIALLAIAVFQYLVAAYPGQILAGALLFTLYLSVQVRATTSLERRRYLIATAAGGISGLLMSMVKWYPVVENWTLLEPNAATRPALVHGAHLWTLLFSVSPHFVPNEITLRSLFIPASIVAAVAWLRTWRGDVIGYASIVVVALLIASHTFGVFDWLQLAPGGAGASRMLILDYRGFVHVGLFMLAGFGIDGALRAPPPPGATFVRAGASLVVLAALSVTALQLGWPRSELSSAAILAMCVLVISVAAVGAGRSRSLGSLGSLGSIWVAPSLTVLAIASAWTHHAHYGHAWRATDSDYFDQRYFGESLEAVLERERMTEWTQRPARIKPPLTDGVPFAKWWHSDYSQNLSWYLGRFSTSGHNNMKRSTTHLRLWDALIEESTLPSTPLLAFLMAPSAFIVDSAEASFVPSRVAECMEEQHCNASAGTEVRMVAFQPAGARYEIKATERIRMVENELAFPGWQATLRPANDHAPARTLVADRVEPGLRSWEIPAGRFVLHTRFRTPGRTESWALFGLGLLGALCGTAFTGPSRNDSGRTNET